MPAAELKYGGDEEYRRLWAIRDRYGVTWRGMLLEGAKFLEEHDLIGENAPGYLECNGNGDRSGAAWLEPDHTDPGVQRVDLADHDIDCLQIEVTLIDADTDPADGTETTAEADRPNGGTAATASSGSEGGREGEERSEGESEPVADTTDTDETEEVVTSPAVEPTDAADHTADSSPIAHGRDGITGDTRRQGGQGPTPPPPRAARFPGRVNNGD